MQAELPVGGEPSRRSAAFRTAASQRDTALAEHGPQASAQGLDGENDGITCKLTGKKKKTL